MADAVFAERYRHASAHDSRADGAFVVGWLMSETFCRPGCASRTPRPSRVAFYRTAAAAYAAGLAPCPRCRPDMTPPAPDLLHGDGLGERALRLIADGVVDRHGVPGLAKALGITSRHVLRAVSTVADCGPLDMARALRVQLARLLLTTTSISMRDVSTAAGFATVRQFNSTIMALDRVTPGAIRFGRRPVQPGGREAGALVVRCTLATHRPAPAALFAALAAAAVPDVESGTDQWYARTMRLPHGFGHVRVDRDATGHLFARLTVAHLRDFAPLLFRTEQIVSQGATAHASGATDRAEDLLRAAIGCGVSPESARVALGGLAHALGDATPWGTVFPTAGTIALAGRTVLRGDRERIRSIIRMSESIASGVIDVGGGWSSSALLTRHGNLLPPPVD